MPNPSGFEASDSTAVTAAPERSGVQVASLFQSGNRDYFSAVESSVSSNNSDLGANSMLNGFELDFENDLSAANPGTDANPANDPGSVDTRGGDNPRGGDDHSRDSRRPRADEKPDSERAEPTKREIRPQERPNEDKLEAETCTTSRFDRSRGGLVGILEGLMALQQQQYCDQQIAEARARNERRRQLPP